LRHKDPSTLHDLALRAAFAWLVRRLAINSLLDQTFPSHPKLLIQDN